MDRPKRFVNRPFRYQTTSSDEELARRTIKKAHNPSTLTDAEINKDIDDLRGILNQQEDNTHLNNFNNNTFSQFQEFPHSEQDFSQISTDTPSHKSTYQPTYTATCTSTYTPTYTTLLTSHTLPNNCNNYSNSSTHTLTHTHKVLSNINIDENNFQPNVEQGCDSRRYYPSGNKMENINR